MLQGARLARNVFGNSRIMAPPAQMLATARSGQAFFSIKKCTQVSRSAPAAMLVCDQGLAIRTHTKQQGTMQSNRGRRSC